jgi:hypothetical protein
MRKHGLLVGCGFAALAFACGPRSGTDVGNGATTTFDVGAYKTKSGSQTDALTLESGVSIETFWISTGSFRLMPGAGCTGPTGNGKIDHEGPIVADLLQADAAPGRSEPVEIDAGDYCQLQAELEPVDASELPTGAPNELVDAVIFISGTRADGTPFTVRSGRGVELQLDAPEGAPFEMVGENALTIAFDLETMILSLELDEVDGESIVIDETSDPPRLAAFENSVRGSARLFRDEDEDGVLDEEESTPGKALALGQVE